MLFTVAAGNRSNTTGALADVGTNGRYWSSSSYAAGNNNAGNLNFGSDNVNPLNNGNRAIGRSVRCVQHLRGCFSEVKEPAYPCFGPPVFHLSFL